VNPFLTNAYLTWSTMAVLGRGELAARIPLVPAVVIAAVVAGGLAFGPRRSGWAYLTAVSALYVLWNAYYVGYEPTFTDLAEPAATDTLMVALWLAGFAEIAAGAVWIGVGSLWLAAFVLYSAPVLALPALVFYGMSERRWRPLVLWCGAGAVALAAALAYGTASGDLADWIRQVRSEYWYDLVDQTRRTATLPSWAAWSLGGLPLLLVRWRRLPAPARALGSALYLAIALFSSYKNLHYPVAGARRPRSSPNPNGRCCAVPSAWPRTIALGRMPRSLLIEDFDPRDTWRTRARAAGAHAGAGRGPRPPMRAPRPAAGLEARVNGGPVRGRRGRRCAKADLGRAGWRRGWNVLGRSRPGGLVLDEIGRSPP
jgi:hypothetical protein